MAKMFYEKDCDLGKLDGKVIGIVGYGSQGHAHALNLRDSGCNVIIGLRKGGKSWPVAEKDGFEVMTVPELTGEKDIDDTEVSIDLALGTVTVEELFNATVTANFGITDVYSIFSKDGQQVYKLASRADINNRKELKVKTEELFVDTWGEYPEKGVYDLQVLVQLYTGERITVYEGRVRV